MITVHYLEMQYNSPDQAKRQLGITIHNILGAYVDQFDILKAQKVQRHLCVLQHVETHFALLSWLLSKTSIEISWETQLESPQLVATTYQVFAR